MICLPDFSPHSFSYGCLISPRRSLGPHPECSLQFVPACSHPVWPLSRSWLIQVLEEACPEAPSSTPPALCRFRWAHALIYAISIYFSCRIIACTDTAACPVFHLFVFAPAGSVLLLGDWNCLLRRLWGGQWPDCVLWFCHRGGEEGRSVDQPCWDVSVSQVCLHIDWNLLPTLSLTWVLTAILLFPFSYFCLSPVCPSVLVFVCVSNGRAVHYNGSSLLQWKSVRLDVALLPGERADK